MTKCGPKRHTTNIGLKSRLPSGHDCEMFPYPMSEFKYACPVCGQHIKCDSSQAGTQMDCPTCFQKITVPQAPATEEQKFILTGTKKTERPIPKAPEDRAPLSAPKKSPLAAAIIVLILLGLIAAGAVAYKFHDKIFKTAPTETAQSPE